MFLVRKNPTHVEQEKAISFSVDFALKTNWKSG